MNLEELYIEFLDGISRRDANGFGRLRGLKKLKVLSVVKTTRFFKAFRWIKNIPPNLSTLYYAGSDLTKAGLVILRDKNKGRSLYDFEEPLLTEYPHTVLYTKRLNTKRNSL